MARTRNLIGHAIVTTLLLQLIAVSAVVANPRSTDDPPPTPPGTVVVNGRVVELPTASEIAAMADVEVLPGVPPVPVPPLDASQIGNTTLTALAPVPDLRGPATPIESFTVTVDVQSPSLEGVPVAASSPIRIRRSSARQWVPPRRDDSLRGPSIAGGVTQVGDCQIRGVTGLA